MTICATFLEAAAPPYYSLDDLGENSRSGSPRRPSAFAAQNDTPPNTVVPQPPLHSDPKARRIQAIANTAGFHFAFIEQGGSSLYSTLALKVTNLEGPRIVISLGGVEEDPFSLWHDKAGNPVAQPLAGVTDPETGLRFPDFNDSSTFPSEEFQTTLSLPEPAEFLRPGFPAVSIIRPTSTVRAGAVAAIQSFTDDLLFAGQTPEFIETVMGWSLPGPLTPRNAKRSGGNLTPWPLRHESGGCGPHPLALSPTRRGGIRTASAAIALTLALWDGRVPT